jgi:hypothetical protein
MSNGYQGSLFKVYLIMVLKIGKLYIKDIITKLCSSQKKKTKDGSNNLMKLLVVYSLFHENPLILIIF